MNTCSNPDQNRRTADRRYQRRAGPQGTGQILDKVVETESWIDLEAVVASYPPHEKVRLVRGALESPVAYGKPVP